MKSDEASLCGCAFTVREEPMDATQGFTRRLSFGEVSLHLPQQLDVQDVLASLKCPSVEGFQE